MSASPPRELIPDDGLLYRRVWSGHVRTNGRIDARVFMDSPSDEPGEPAYMSVVWAGPNGVYASPADALRDFDSQADSVAEFIAGGVRAIDELKVLHKPTLQCRAHTGVYGEKDPEVRILLKRIARLVYERGHSVPPSPLK